MLRSPRTPSDLPVEVLRMIFTWHAKLHSSLMRQLWSFPPWIAITHVCHYWRAVALDHRSLWTSITPELGLGWIKASIERSKPLLIDVSLFHNGPWSPKMYVVINLVRDCMRLGSLHINGFPSGTVKLLEALGSQTSIHTLSLCSHFNDSSIELPVAMFGRQAPIRVLSFNSDGCFIAPLWCLHGVNRFSCHQQTPFHALLDALREMPMLQYFELQRCSLPWEDTDASPSPPIQMPNLMYFSVEADSLRFFTLLNERLELPEGAKRKLELVYQVASDLDSWAIWIPRLLIRVPPANRLTHIQLSGGAMEGTIRIWAGDLSTTDHKDAEFSFTAICTGYVRLRHLNGKYHPPVIHLAALCDLLGAATAHTLIFDPCQRYCGRFKKLTRAALWSLLGRLPAVEKLELGIDGAEVLWNMWKMVGSPAVLPALRSIETVNVDSTAPRVAKITEGRLLRLLQDGGKGRRNPRK
jgi:hypothetical protein